MFQHDKECRIVKNEHIIEVYFYDRLPKGKQEEEEILNTLGVKVEELPHQESWWVDEESSHPLGKIIRGNLKDFAPKGWLVDKSREKEYRKTVNYRARERIRRLAINNFHAGDLFLTLTFRENMQDIDFANAEVKKFMKRFRYKYGAEIPYLGVIEFQKRGAIHYHILLGCRFPDDVFSSDDARQSKEREIGEIWGHGFVDIAELYDSDNIGAYLVKYLSKDIGDERLSGHKHYLMSKGLKRPDLIKDTRVMLDSLEGYYPTFTSRYKTEFCGDIHYLEFNLKRGGAECLGGN